MPVWDCGSKHLYLNKLIIPLALNRNLKRNATFTRRLSAKRGMSPLIWIASCMIGCGVRKLVIRRLPIFGVRISLTCWRNWGRWDWRNRFIQKIYPVTLSGDCWLLRFLLPLLLFSKLIAMNDFKNGSFETVSDEELSQVSGGEANIGVDPCTLKKSETECLNAGCRWQAYNQICQSSGLRFIYYTS